MELIKWETHAYPNFGEDSQEVITTQIKDDYDIFIGIMWRKFGSQTNRSGSGTKDEFIYAYEKWKRLNGKGITIMFYFKNAPILPDNIDVEQIKFLKEFKTELDEKGGLYWQYKDIEEFKQFVRIHLNKALTDLVNAEKQVHTSSKVSPSVTSLVVIEDDQNEELGLLEIMELSLDKFTESGEILRKIGNNFEELTIKIQDRTAALNKLSGTSESIRIREGKRIVNQVAEDLFNFVNRSKVEIPIFKSNYEVAFKAFSNSYSIWQTLDADKDDLEKVRESIEFLKEMTIGLISNVSAFRETIENLPHMTSLLNKAKKQTLEVLDALKKELEFTLQLANEFDNS